MYYVFNQLWRLNVKRAFVVAKLEWWKSQQCHSILWTISNINLNEDWFDLIECSAWKPSWKRVESEKKIPPHVCEYEHQQLFKNIKQTIQMVAWFLCEYGRDREREI